MSNQVVIRPKNNREYYVGFQPKAEGQDPHVSRVESLSDACFLKVLYNHLNKSQKLQENFVITHIKSNKDRSTFQVTFEDDHQKTRTVQIYINAIKEELDLESSAHLSFQSTSTNPQTAEERRRVLLDSSFKDGFTLAATSYFEIKKPTVSQVPRKWNTFKPQQRLAVAGNDVVLTKRGLSRFEMVFHRVFHTRTYKKYIEQNSQTIEAYQKFLINEIGEEKVSLIERTFGFSLDTMKEEGHPLLPIHVYYFNIGMNDIGMEDVEQLAKKLEDFQYDEETQTRALDFFQDSPAPFTMRELRGLLALFKNPQTVTIGDLVKLRRDPHFFNRCLKALKTPREDLDRVYTGRKFKALLRGTYNQEVDDTKTARLNIDMQELSQLESEILDVPHDDPQADRIFNEYLAKIVSKKAMMRSTADGKEWRVGSIIPSPFRDAKGERVWYRIDQGVDSGHGKLWYVIKPADDSCDQKFPVYRVARDTCPRSYHMRGGPTLTRDIAKEPGYKYSNTTEEEDREFFDQFTLPIWMGHLFMACQINKKDKRSEDPQIVKEAEEAEQAELEALERAKDALIDDCVRRYSEKGVSKEEVTRLHQLQEDIEKEFASTDKKANHLYRALYKAASEKDQITFNNLTRGVKPRPVVLAGNSLGGFDTQYDLVQHTAARHRIPIVDLSVYTHSTLKIKETDDEIFTHFMRNNDKVLDALNVKLSFDHITEQGDVVSIFGRNRTFLGHQLPGASFRVFTPLKTSQHPEITQSQKHIRRVEHLKAGEDITWLTLSVDQYKQWGARKKIGPRNLDRLHTIGNRIIATERIWKTSRYLNNRDNRIARKDRNSKLVVPYKQAHRLTPIPKEQMDTRSSINLDMEAARESLGFTRLHSQRSREEEAIEEVTVHAPQELVGETS